MKEPCENCKETPQKQQSVTSSIVQEWRYHNPLFKENFESKNMKAIKQNANQSSAVRIRLHGI